MLCKLIENSQIKLKVGLILKNDRLSRRIVFSDVDYSDHGRDGHDQRLRSRGVSRKRKREADSLICLFTQLESGETGT